MHLLVATSLIKVTKLELGELCAFVNHFLVSSLVACYQLEAPWTDTARAL